MKYDFAFGWETPYGHAVRLVEANAPAGGLVLDLGCGGAAIASPLAELGFGYHGVDVDQEAVDTVRRRGVTADVVDLMDDKAVDELSALIGDQPLAAVTALDVVEHLATPESFLGRIRELVGGHPGAVVVLSIPNVAHRDLAAKLVAGRWDVTPTGLLDATHISLFTEERVRRAAQAAGLTEVGRDDFVLARSDQFFPTDHPALSADAPLAHLLGHVRGRADRYAEVNQFIRAYTVAEDPPATTTTTTTAGAAPELREPRSQVEIEAPFLSVLVPLGKGGDLVVETLTCLAAQTDPDIEVVLLDGGDDRRELASVERLVTTFEPAFAARVAIHHLPEANRAELLTAGFELARGSHVAVLDAADLVTADWVATFRDGAAVTPGSVIRSVALVQDVGRGGDPGVVLTQSGFRAEHPARFSVIDHLDVNATPPGSAALPLSAVRALTPWPVPGAEDGDVVPELADWWLVLQVALWAGVHDTARPTVVRRRFSGEATDTAEWARARAALLDGLDAAPLLLPRGSASALAGPEPTWDWRAQLGRVRQLEAQLAAAASARADAEQGRRDAHDALVEARSEMMVERTELVQARDDAEARHRRLLAEHSTVMEQRRMLAGTLEQTRDELEALRHALALHQGSKWWKLTAPARRIWLVLRHRRFR